MMDALTRVGVYRRVAKKNLDNVVQGYTGEGGVVDREGLLNWLLDAYVSLSVGREEIIHMVDVLRDHVLNWPETQKREFTVDDARMFHVCRICKGEVDIEKNGPLVLEFGKEFAHQKCLDNKEGEDDYFSVGRGTTEMDQRMS